MHLHIREKRNPSSPRTVDAGIHGFIEAETCRSQRVAGMSSMLVPSQARLSM